MVAGVARLRRRRARPPLPGPEHGYSIADEELAAFRPQLSVTSLATGGHAQAL